MPPVPPASPDDLQSVQRLKEAFARIKTEVGKIIVGQDEVVEQVMTCIFSKGHALLVGVPGLAKTLLIRTLANVLSLHFKRIQFTPDLMPADITGTEIIHQDPATGNRQFKFRKGPIFSNIILADEINRTPPKTQAALLEAMQEHSVTVGDNTYPLDEPFFVLATQNPIEQEGTYPLPEAQLDRFMFNIWVDYPTREEELKIMKVTTSSFSADLGKVLDGPETLALQDIVRKVPVAEHVYEFALNLSTFTRPKSSQAPDFIKELVSWGAGPRASQYLILAGKARAILHGRYHVTTEDIEKVAHPVLRHRVITNFNAESQGITSDKLIDQLIPIAAKFKQVALV